MVKLNSAGRANLEAIVSGFVADQAEAWGGRVIEVRRLPSLALVSAWAVGRDALQRGDTTDLWREAGDGLYLVAMIDGPSAMLVVVSVEGGYATRERPVTAAELVAIIPPPDDDTASTSRPRRLN